VPALKNREHWPILVIGTGIAGLTTALCLAEAGIKVLLVTKSADPKDCNTFWAQGGIIYQGEGDSPARITSSVRRRRSARSPRTTHSSPTASPPTSPGGGEDTADDLRQILPRYTEHALVLPGKRHARQILGGS